MTMRRIRSRDVRHAAAEVAATRPHPDHRSNGDEQRLRAPDGTRTYAGSFTKSLPHDEHGFVREHDDYEQWIRAIDSGDARDFERLRMGPGPFTPAGDPQFSGSSPIHQWAHTYATADGEPAVRAWESMGAGVTYDLEGPDAQAVTMPPAPSLDSQELIAEMG